MTRTMFRWARKLYGINREAIQWAIQRKRLPHTNLSPTELPAAVLTGTQCCFVLSTGRCGSGLLTKILDKHPLVEARLQPKPELVYLSKLAYLEAYNNRDSWKSAALHARYDILEDCYIRHVIYVETNNRITFYAPYLAELFPKSRFIHLIRDPRDFVRSGLRRGYYTGVSTDKGRIVPRDDSPIAAQWTTMSQTAKIAWLWNETNSFIEDFKAKISNQRIMTLLAEDLFKDPSVSEKVFTFVGVAPLSRKWITARIAKPMNVQRTGNVPDYIEWAETEKKLLKKWVPLASHYQYSLQ